jgi:hypothetical protein
MGALCAPDMLVPFKEAGLSPNRSDSDPVCLYVPLPEHIRVMTKTANNITMTCDTLRCHGNQQRQTAQPSGWQHYECPDNGFTLGRRVMYQQGLKQNKKEKERVR